MAEYDSARDEILAQIRHSLNVDPVAGDRVETVAERLGCHRRNIVPQRAKGTHAQNVERFRRRIEAVDATAYEVKFLTDIPAVIEEYLRDHNLSLKIRRGVDPALESLAWSKAPALQIVTGAARKTDKVSLSRAFCAVAETGTLVMTSGSRNPTTLNFLPENHIVIIEAGRIVGSYEDVWDEMRKVYGEGEMPRAVNLISGPSRTADVEQKIELGAHGPRRLHVIILRHVCAYKLQMPQV